MKKLHRLSIIAATVALFAALLAASAHAYALSPLQMRMMREQGGTTLRASGVGALAEQEGCAPRAEKIIEYGGKLYGVASYAASDYRTYAASDVFELDTDLKVLRKVTLDDGTNKGLNAADMIMSNGKLYVICMGGGQYVGTYGDVWTVDTTTTEMTAKRVLDFKDATAFSSKTNAIPNGIEIGNGGAAYLLVQIFETIDTGTYTFDTSTSSRLFVTTLSDIEQGKLGNTIEFDAATSSLLFDKTTSSLLLEKAGGVEVRSASGELAQTITPSELGNKAYRLTLLADGEGVFYTAVTDDYTAGSTGKLTRSVTAYTVTKGVANLGGDPAGFAYKDAAGTSRVIVREFNYGGTDTLTVWKASDITATADLNETGRTNNIHDVTYIGDYLYLACYDHVMGASTTQFGEFVKLSMSDLSRVNEYRPDFKQLSAQAITPVSNDLPSNAPSTISLDKALSCDFTGFTASADAAAQSLKNQLFSAADGSAAISTTLAEKLAGDLVKSNALAGASVKSVKPLPIFKTASTKDGLAAVSFSVSAADLGTGPASNVQVIKIKSADMAIPFTYSALADTSDYKDGVFSVLQGGAPVSNIVSGSYTLTLIIKDNGKYDVCGGDGVILDPSAIVTTERPSGSSSGGCGVGAFGLLAAGLAVAIFRKK